MTINENDKELKLLLQSCDIGDFVVEMDSQRIAFGSPPLEIPITLWKFIKTLVVDNGKLYLVLAKQTSTEDNLS